MNSKRFIKERRNKTPLIKRLVAERTLLYGFQTTEKQLGVVIPHRNQLFFAKIKFNQINSICFQDRQELVTGGHLCVPLIQRLLCFNGKYAVKYPFKMGQCILSRRHFLDYSFAPCVLTLDDDDNTKVLYQKSDTTTMRVDSIMIFGKSCCSKCIAFNPTGTLMVTSNWDNTMNLRHMSSDNPSTTCVATIKPHNYSITSAAFHPTQTLLVTCSSSDNIAKLWHISLDNSSMSCVATLVGHERSINSVAFNSTGTLIATASNDNTVKLWLTLSATCVATLVGHKRTINSVAFNPKGTLLATASDDCTVNLWLISSATCVATLKGHKSYINSVAFNQTGTLIATGSMDKTVKLWRLSNDDSLPTCMATLEGHRASVESVAFHPSAPFIATSGFDSTVKLWRLSADNSNATCMMTLWNIIWSRDCVNYVVFDPTGTFLATSCNNNVNLLR